MFVAGVSNLLTGSGFGADLPEYSVQSVGAAMIAAMKFGFDAVKSKARKRST
jgi:hypothetical protein